MEKLYRIEKDFLGEKEIELNKYYGIQTLRAKENFDITKTDISLFPSFIKSLAKVLIFSIAGKAWRLILSISAIIFIYIKWWRSGGGRWGQRAWWG